MGGGAEGRSGLAKSFAMALATQLSNPKIVAVFGAVFAALLPADPPLWLDLALPPLIFCQETLWYGLVALAFSAAAPRAMYLRARTVIDRMASTIIGLLGVRLILDAR
jgi:threonine/homoserine/homoserine lactone efflux protein